MTLRAVVLSLAALGVPLALLVLVLPITWSYGGYNVEGSPGAPNATIAFVDPSGPAARAGLRPGQRVIMPVGNDFVEWDAGPVGTVAHQSVIGANGKITVVSFPFVAFTGSLGVQEQIYKFVNALTALFAFSIAIVVLLRARNQRVGARAATVLFLSGLSGLALGGALVCGNAWCAEILAKFIPAPAAAAAIWASLWMLAIYPANHTRLRRILAWYGIVPVAATVTHDLVRAHYIATGQGGGAFAFVDGPAGTFIAILSSLVLAVAIIDAIVSARGEDIAAVRWLGGMWLIATTLRTVPFVTLLAGNGVLFTHYGDLYWATVVFFTAFGVAYPVLRHRLVDLNIIVSRATVFAVVSAIIVGIFVAAEWALGKLFERSFGLSHDTGGLVSQLLALVIVLVLGLSARSIHRFVDERMMRAFFRKRLQGLAAIERVAHEADAATDLTDLMELGVATVNHGLSPLGVAFYLRRGDHYDSYIGTGADTLTPSYRFNDGIPLRLRRWQEPFEVDDESDEHLHMLFVPMTVRGELIGFLCCGPKPDRTAYLEDETRALALLTHHIAIASALLPRAADGPSTGLTLAAT